MAHQSAIPQQQIPIPVICIVCLKPVVLEQSKTNERGQPIHEGCYLQQLHSDREGKN